MKSRWISQIDKYLEQTRIQDRQVSRTDKHPGQTSILDRQFSRSSKSPGLASLWYRQESQKLSLLDRRVFQTLHLLDRQVPLKGKNFGKTSLLVGQVNLTDKSLKHKVSRQTSFWTDEAPGQSSLQDDQGSRTKTFLGPSCFTRLSRSLPK